MGRLVVSSDWHADWITDGVERDAELSNAVMDIVNELRAGDTFIFLGDLSNPYTRNVHAAVAIAVDTATRCSDMGIPSYWLPGNHDVCEDPRGSHTLMAVEAIGTGPIYVMSRPSLVERHGVNYIALPYTSPVHAYDPAEHIRLCAERMTKKQRALPTVVMGHLMLEGIGPGSETIDMPRGRDIMFPIETVQECFPGALMMNGHYHEGQVWRGVHIPGSLMRLTHGEEELVPRFLVFETTGY